MACPRCRMFIDRLAADVPFPEHTDIRCPWCSMIDTAERWAEAATRELCECGCPRAAHVAFLTSDGEAPGGGGGQRMVPVAAPCIGCGCVRVSGAHEVRLT